MPYTPPAGDAANFNFSPTPATPRAGDNADLSWQAGAFTVSWKSTRFGTATITPGFLTTRFGTPLSRIALTASSLGPTTTVGDPRRTTLAPVGAWTVSTTFGTPVAPPFATGFLVTRFGTPNSPYLQTCAATGATTTALGSPRLSTLIGVAFGVTPTTVVSLAYTRFTQTVQGSGFASAHLGTPRLGTAVVPPTGAFVGAAAGWQGTSFGAPASPRAQTTAASSFSLTRYGWPRALVPSNSTAFGTPTLGIGQRATGFLVGALGVPTIARGAQGFTGTAFGAALAKKKYPAIGFTAARIGVPTAFLFGHKVYAIQPIVRVGRPSSTNRINRRASGWSSTQVPTPIALDRHRAAQLAPPALFGVALLKRNSAC